MQCLIQSTEVSSAHLCLKFEGEMSIYYAQQIKEALLEAMAQPYATLELDLSDVTELDTAGVQLLLLAQREMNAAGRQLRMSQQSPAVAAVLGLLRL
ncbi:STAS domain-containing protein [Thiorhodospira sibirica]|uniref:STAS domain-containing protein n=1 Tax=Thiorhodospira sibirica TaxID=154347 RepID=UPI00022C229C|nr:STAS domain-containing protein [Thiorhodospira sibirica]